MRAAPLVAMVIALGLVLATGVPTAHAQDRRDDSRAHFQAGMAAMAQGQWALAEREFVRAYELYPWAPTLLNIANVQEHQGHLCAAVATFARFLQTPEEPDPAAHALRAEAARGRAALEARLAHVRLRLRPGATDVRVLIDAARVDPAGSIALDPGSHTVQVFRGDRQVASAGFALIEGATREVVLLVPPSPARRPSPPPPRVSPWIWVVAGVLVAGGVTAAVIVATQPSGYYNGSLDPGHLMTP